MSRLFRIAVQKFALCREGLMRLRFAPAVLDGNAPRQLPWWLTFLSAGLPSVLVVQASLDLYRKNFSELSRGDVPLPAIIGCGIALWAALFFMLQWGRHFGKAIWAVASAYSIFYVIREVAFPLPLGELDGTNPLREVSAGYVIFECAVLMSVLLLLVRCRRERTTAVVAIFVGVFGVSNLLTAAKCAALPDTGKRSRAATTLALSSPAAPQNGKRPDVYQILFDTYQTVEYEMARKMCGRSPYEDFVFFKNNICNYSCTYLSMPALMTSTYYKSPADIDDWATSYKRRGLLPALKKAGYTVNVYGYHSHWWDSPYVDFARCTREIVAERLAGPHEFTDMLKLRFFPSILAASVFSSSNGSGQPPASASAYYCTVKFREMLARIKQTEIGNNYHFIHMILPHGPFVMNKQGNYVDCDRGTRFGQVLFADKLLGELIGELKGLGRYDDALIIVHADTGSDFDPDMSRQRLVDGKQLKLAASYPMSNDQMIDGSRWPRTVVEARSQALLLVKPPGHRGYRVSEAPSHLMDLPPTILGVAGIKAAEDQFPEGVNLLANPPHADRSRKTFILGVKLAGQRKNALQQWIVERGEFERCEATTFVDKTGVLISLDE